jgi:hypothetical protein
MVENKKSVYDSENPPLVEAMPTTGEVHEADLLQLNTVEAVEEFTSSSVPRAPTSPRHESTHQSNASSIEDIPTLPTDEEELVRNRTIGAGVFSGVVGLFLGGPFVAMILGFGAAYATERQGAVGDTARAVGDVALSVREKAIEIDGKHNVVEKSKVVAQETLEKAKEMDRKHHILERTKDLLVYSWNSTVEFFRRNRVMERGVEGVGRSAEWVAGKVAGSNQAAPVTNATTTGSNRS